MDDEGRYTSDAGPALAGLSVLQEGNSKVIAIIGQLLRKEVTWL